MNTPAKQYDFKCQYVVTWNVHRQLFHTYVRLMDGKNKLKCAVCARIWCDWCALVNVCFCVNWNSQRRFSICNPDKTRHEVRVPANDVGTSMYSWTAEYSSEINWIRFHLQHADSSVRQRGNCHWTLAIEYTESCCGTYFIRPTAHNWHSRCQTNNSRVIL